MSKRIVVAIGGNSLIKDNAHQNVDDQYAAVCETAKYIVDLVERGMEVVVTHGNGPQVGFIMRRSEIAEEVEHMHPVPLVSCDADTQGAIGYQIQQALRNELVKRGFNKRAVTLITQVEVDGEDPAFLDPKKPIGGFYEESAIETIREKHPDWQMVWDAGRGYRRVVPSPKPIKVVEKKAIQSLLDSGFLVIAVGGGGIPVVRNGENELVGVNAVIDKDRASALLAGKIHADYLMISTAVEQVCLHFNTPNEVKLSHISMKEAQQYLEGGEFAPGSMAPKVEACIDFIDRGGKKAFITTPANMLKAIEGLAGTVITKQ